MRGLRLTIILPLILFSVAQASSQGELPKELLEKFYKKELIKLTKEKLKNAEDIVPKKLKLKDDIPPLRELLKKYSPQKLLSSIPKAEGDKKLYVLPVEYLFFLPFEEYYLKWEGKGVKIIILSRGMFTLEELYRYVKDSSLLSKDGNKTYTLKAPLFIGNGAKLIVKDATLRLAFEPGAPIMCSGEIYILNSEVLTWDTKNNRYLPIGKIDRKSYYLYGAQKPRPYIVAIAKGRLVVVSSVIKGLGYRGLFSSFGLGANAWKKKGPPTSLMNFFLMSALKNTHSTSQGKPPVVLIGNTIEDNYMGYYSNEVEGAVVLGNIFKNNYQYNFDPHDWSKELLVGYNIFEGARKAHGIVFSRFTEGKVFKNICAGNHGAGVMMDRLSKAFIKGNIILGNEIGGISFLESDGNAALGNIIVRNNAYGIFVRNSLNVLVEGNKLKKNGGAGVEVSVIDISYQTYRNLYLDPYHLASSAWVEGNEVESNMNGEVKTFAGGVAIFRNRFKSISLVPFGGDLKLMTGEILSKQERTPVIVKGKGRREWIKKEFPDVISALSKIEENAFKDGNREAILALFLSKVSDTSCKAPSCSEIIKQLKLLADKGDSGALSLLGVISLGKSRERALCYLAKGAALGNLQAKYLLFVLPFVSGISPNEINRAFERVLSEINDCSNDLTFKKLKSFRKRFLISKSSSYYEFLRKELKPFVEKSIRSKLEKIKKRIEKKNVRFFKYFRWEEEKLKEALREYRNKSLEAEGFFEKSKTAKNTWTELLRDSSEEDFNGVKDELSRLLKEINLFRTDRMKLNVEEELEHFKEKYFEGG